MQVVNSEKESNPTNNAKQNKIEYSIQILKDSIYSDATKESYVYSLKQFTTFYNIENCDDLLKLEKSKIFDMIRNYLMYLRNERKSSYSRINIFFSAIKLFYLQNDNGDNDINWLKLARFKGRYTPKVIEDRTYTIDEIQKLLNAADLRMKVCVLTMLSSGIRVGGLAELRIKDLTYLENYKLYRLKVYSDSPNLQYYTFTTPECASFINTYFQYRINQGEDLLPESPFIKQKFECVVNPIVSSKDIQERMRTLLIESGILERKKKDHSKNRKIWTYIEKSDSKRHRNEVMRCHGLRKFFNTVCIESDMNIVSKEMLMGHKQKMGLEKSYYRPTSDKLLNEYLKVVDNLTINDENRLKRENQQLKQKHKAQELRLTQLEERFEKLTEKFTE